MEYKSQIIENLTPDLIQLGATNANPQVATLIVSKENENVSVGEIQGGTFISKFMVKSNSSSENQIVLQHSGNGVPIAGIGQESSHGSLQLRLNSGATQVRLSAINNNYIILITPNKPISTKMVFNNWSKKPQHTNIINKTNNNFIYIL